MYGIMTDILKKNSPAALVLADGTVFEGISIGKTGQTVGEVVFNTSMLGYQEILTDPSYAHQIITFTYPHIGNTGITLEDMESNKIYAAGVVIAHLSPIASSWRSSRSLDYFLKTNHIVGIAEIDTRQLTRLLREKGAQSGCIMSEKKIDINEAGKQACRYPSLRGQNLADIVSTDKNYAFQEKTFKLPTKYAEPSSHYKTKKIVVYDFGVKHQILRLLNDRNCQVTVVPSNTPADTVIKMQPDGVLLSNGPGDPAACCDAVNAVKTLLKKNIPIFGICLGCQILALASHAHTSKMKFGHHGGNHPVQNTYNGSVSITSQNHGFSIDKTNLPENIKITHRSLFDDTIQGIRLTDKPAIGFQGHPEASPGPHDIEILFDQFMEMIHA
jgi:carbamoyl-phosphate synthase small subunit